MKCGQWKRCEFLRLCSAILRSNQGDGADRRPGASANLQRRGYKQEFLRARCSEFFEVEALDDMDAAFDEQMYVDPHLRARREFEGRGVAARCVDLPLAE